jgi:hypothetical protein
MTYYDTYLFVTVNPLTKHQRSVPQMQKLHYKNCHIIGLPLVTCELRCLSSLVLSFLSQNPNH